MWSLVIAISSSTLCCTMSFQTARDGQKNFRKFGMNVEWESDGSYFNSWAASNLNVGQYDDDLEDEHDSKTSETSLQASKLRQFETTTDSLADGGEVESY